MTARSGRLGRPSTSPLGRSVLNLDQVYAIGTASDDKAPPTPAPPPARDEPPGKGDAVRPPTPPIVGKVPGVPTAARKSGKHTSTRPVIARKPKPAPRMVPRRVTPKRTPKPQIPVPPRRPTSRNLDRRVPDKPVAKPVARKLPTPPAHRRVL